MVLLCYPRICSIPRLLTIWLQSEYSAPMVQPNRTTWCIGTAKMVQVFRIDGAWWPHGIHTATTLLDYSEIAFSRLIDSPLMVST